MGLDNLEGAHPCRKRTFSLSVANDYLNFFMEGRGVVKVLYPCWYVNWYSYNAGLMQENILLGFCG